jgi:hypothetical protein
MASGVLECNTQLTYKMTKVGTSRSPTPVTLQPEHTHPGGATAGLLYSSDGHPTSWHLVAWSRVNFVHWAGGIPGYTESLMQHCQTAPVQLIHPQHASALAWAAG